MMRRVRRHRILYFTAILTVVAAFYNMFSIYKAASLNEKSLQLPASSFSAPSHVKLGGTESGSVDRSSRWRKLSSSTYVFSAYLDDRNAHSTVISVLGFGTKLEPFLNGTLLLHNNGREIPLGMTVEKKMLSPYGPYTIKSLGAYAYVWPLPSHITDRSYLKSIVVEQIHPVKGTKTRVEIPITIPEHSTKSFGVCIDSPLFGRVKPLTTIESIEINKALGAEWFTFYIYAAEQTTLEVLRDYAREGTVEVVLNWGNGFPKWSTTYYGQTMSINECAYRNMHRVKYLVYTDLDEYIVPEKSLGWSAMMAKIEDPKYGTYLFRHAYFLANGSRTPHSGQVEFTCKAGATYRVDLPTFLTRIVRSRKISPPTRKSKYIIKPLLTSAVGVHLVFAHIDDSIRTFVVPPDFALLHHYRSIIREKLSTAAADVQQNQRAFAYKEKIISALRGQWCRWNVTKLG